MFLCQPSRLQRTDVRRTCPSAISIAETPQRRERRSASWRFEEISRSLIIDVDKFRRFECQEMKEEIKTNMIVMRNSFLKSREKIRGGKEATFVYFHSYREIKCSQ